MAARILIIEDEPAIAELIAINLRHAGHAPVLAPDAASAQRRISDELPDLVLLDWMLPDASGVDFARRLRGDTRTRDLPIIMLTARSEESDKIRGFDSGADDYMTKPFSPREMLARVRALLRRSAPEASPDPVEIEGLRVDPEGHRVTAHGHAIRLSPIEFRLLHFMMKRPDRLLSRAKLLDGVWGDHVFIEERTVDVRIRRLRQALEPSGHDRLIETQRGCGYRFLPAHA